MLQFARGGSPGKLQKALANSRLPGAMPGAESAANMPIANYTARDRVSGVQSFSETCQALCQGLTPGKLCTAIKF
uniref:Uncharacterized protein n=1 Tax=Medicago truncatula TaxID=3880 RepID=Q1S5L6_MEDTR|nr:hypothetical protein MtrDRAFT_AC147431g56v2 [Medicago truncatula]